MPFTFSHPAIILPLTFLPRKWISITGLVIGSLTPDFEYFIRMRIQSDYSHTISGIFWFDLPLAIFLSLIYHNIVRDKLFDNFPTILKSRLFRFKQFNWNKYFKTNWFVVIISILIGTSSHLFWDSFTHENGYFVKTIPELTNTIEIFSRQILILKILQHSSTLIGAFLIALALYRLPTDKIIIGQFNVKYWSFLTSLTLIIIFFKLLISGLDFKLFGNLIVTCISAGLIGLTITPLLMKPNNNA